MFSPKQQSKNVISLTLVCYTAPVIKSDQEHSGSSSPRTPLEEEQFLCNEALRSGDFDAISDSDWVAMCERAANRERLEAKRSSQGDSVLVP